MKKTILTLVVLIYTSIIFGQNLDGFKYVYVPTLVYQNDRQDVWGICSSVRNQFSKLGFVVLTESSGEIDELKSNPCLLLVGKLNHYSEQPNAFGGYFSHVELELLDCNGESILKFDEKGKGLDLAGDFKIATRKINNQLASFYYSFKPSKTPNLKLPEVEKTTETEESLKTYFENNELEAIEGIYKSYQSDQLNYYKIGIKKFGNIFKAIILESDLSYWKKGEVKAVFEPSSMKGFYSVTWYMGDKTKFETFANMDNDALLSIEFKDQVKNEKRQDKFIKMFPTVSKDITYKKDNIKSSGSGFFLTAKGVIATNAHVIDGASKIEITIFNEVGTFTYKAKILLSDGKNDVALLQIDDDTFKGLTSIPYGISENSEVGSKVFTIGYPLNDVMGNNYKVTDGIISAFSGVGDDIRYYQISVPLQPGNSGGPLFNKEGNIIGITSAKLNSKSIGTSIENVNYAIKSSYLLNLYNMLPNSDKLTNSSQIASKELQDQVKVLKNYVCLIKIY